MRFSVPKRLLAVALAVAGVAIAAPAAQAGQAPKTKPTIVLVHGAWADASGWNGVISRLRHDGYTVKAPANPLRGLASDAAYIRGVLNATSGPIVLVGHSYGGAVITNAATGDKDVKALVYVSAFVPDAGDTVLGLATKYEGSKLTPDATQAVPLPNGDLDVSIKPENFADVFSADLPRWQSDLLAVTQRPVAQSALLEPSGTPAWKSIRSWAVVSKADHAIPVAAQRFMTQRAHAKTTEVNASHAALISQPGTVTRVIETAARS
ncbi:alpha/beta fold hydrolase [Actinoplanes sp. CA-131856]